MHLDVVVEVDDDVAALVPPGRDPRRPDVQRLVGVPADVELLVSVQPDVAEVGRRLEDERPLPRRVGGDDRDVVLAQQGGEPRCRRTSGAAPRARAAAAGRRRWSARPGPRASRRAAGRARRRPSVVRGRSAKKSASRSSSYPRFGGSCQSIGPSFGPSASTPEAKKFASGVSTPRSFFMWVTKRPPLTENRKSERRAVVPRAVALRSLQRVEGPVDLDGAQHARRRAPARAGAVGRADRRCRARAGSSSRRCRPAPQPRVQARRATVVP